MLEFIAYTVIIILAVRGCMAMFDDLGLLDEEVNENDGRN